MVPTTHQSHSPGHAMPRRQSQHSQALYRLGVIFSSGTRRGPLVATGGGDGLLTMGMGSSSFYLIIYSRHAGGKSF